MAFDFNSDDPLPYWMLLFGTVAAGDVASSDSVVGGSAIGDSRTVGLQARGFAEGGDLLPLVPALAIQLRRHAGKDNFSYARLVGKLPLGGVSFDIVNGLHFSPDRQIAPVTPTNPTPAFFKGKLPLASRKGGTNAPTLANALNTGLDAAGTGTFQMEDNGIFTEVALFFAVTLAPDEVQNWGMTAGHLLRGVVVHNRKD